ncbi:MAG: glucoamylase family protein [Elusimicrobiota bacterium]
MKKNKFIKYFIFLLVIVFNSSVYCSITDQELLNTIQRKGFDFFWNEVNPNTGLIKDKANNFYTDDFTEASIASVGFGLTVICVGHSRGWITYDQAYDRILTTLNFFKNNMEDKHGFFYHWIDMNDGSREWKSEVSSIDTAIFISGALFAGQYFKGTQIEAIADRLYRDIEWTWMSPYSTSTFVSMGWKPEEVDNFTIEHDGGYLCTAQWDSYNEGVLVDILAVGSPTYPKNTDCWNSMNRYTDTYSGYKYTANCPALFVHQYPHIWIDFRKKRDSFDINYYSNSSSATLANRQFCIDHMDDTQDDGDEDYTTYNQDCWGLTACEYYTGSGTGYAVFGAPFPWINHDGTVAPTAAGGSVMFTPEESINALRYMYENYKSLWGKYGFCDSFNLDIDWNSDKAVGINQGPIVLSIENYRTGMIWEEFMKIDYITDALEKIGFNDTGDNTPPAQVCDLTATLQNGNILLSWTMPGDDGNTGSPHRYEIRYSENNITNRASWNDADILHSGTFYTASGATEEITIDNFNLDKTYYFALKVYDEEGNSSLISNSVSVTDIEKDRIFSYPSPFYPKKHNSAYISYSINTSGDIEIDMYNIAGELVNNFSMGYKNKGNYKFSWNGTNKSSSRIASGVYIILLKKDGKVAATQKIAVIN